MQHALNFKYDTKILCALTCIHVINVHIGLGQELKVIKQYSKTFMWDKKGFKLAERLSNFFFRFYFYFLLSHWFRYCILFINDYSRIHLVLLVANPLIWNQFSRLKKTKSSISLNDVLDETMVEILSRLPGKYVLKCRTACRRWKDLTSTPDFLLFHLKCSTPTMIHGP